MNKIRNHIDMTLMFFPSEDNLNTLSEIITAYAIVCAGTAVPNSNLT